MRTFNIYEKDSETPVGVLRINSETDNVLDILNGESVKISIIAAQTFLSNEPYKILMMWKYYVGNYSGKTPTRIAEI